jgi:hypothetical protein
MTGDELIELYKPLRVRPERKPDIVFVAGLFGIYVP